VIDSRPSDAIALAMRADCPIFVDEEVLNSSRIATGVTGQSYIFGLPESCVENVTLNDVTIQTTNQGVDLVHMTGTFTNVTSSPGPSDPPFVVEENVTVATAGSTPPIPRTPPLAGQVPCS